MAGTSTWLSDNTRVAQQGDCLVELYLTDANGAAATKRYSRRGFTNGSSVITTPDGDTIAANLHFEKRLDSYPVVTQSLWARGRIGGSSIPSAAPFTLSNEDGGLDQFHPNLGYSWRGLQAKVFIVDVLDPANTILKLFDGYIETPRFGLTDVQVPLTGRESLFSEKTSSRVYRGSSWMLELDATSNTETCGHGAPAKLDLTGSMTICGWIWWEALPTSGSRSTFGWLNTTTHPYRILVGSDGSLHLNCTISTATETSSLPASTVATLKPHHVGIIINGVDVTWVVWDEDTQAETITEDLSAFSSATRDGQTGGSASLAFFATTGHKFWLNDWTVWNQALAVEDVRALRHQPMDSADMPAECVFSVLFNDGSGTTVTDQSVTPANGTITGLGAYTWLPDMEGGPDLAGTPKPDLWGERHGIVPILANAVEQAYQVAGGGVIEALLIYEGGVQPGYDANAATYRAFLTTAASAGNALRYLPRGLIKLDNEPILPILCYAKGYNGGALGYVNNGADIIRDIVTRRGPKLTDPGDLDTASFTANETDCPYRMGLYLPEPIPITDALDLVADSMSSYWGYPDNQDFGVWRFVGPAATADWNFTQNDIVGLETREIDTIIYEMILRFRPRDIVLTEDQIAGSVTLTSSWTFWTRLWDEVRITDWTIRAANPGSSSRSVTDETIIYNRASSPILISPDAPPRDATIGAAAEANRRVQLFGVIREAWTVTLTMAAAYVKVGETVTLSYVNRYGTERLGLDGTKKYIVLSKEVAMERGETLIEVWG